MRKLAGWFLVGLLAAMGGVACSKTSDTTAPTSQSSSSSSTTVASSTSSSSSLVAAQAPSTGAAAGAPDKASFLEQGNAICKDMNQQSEGLSQQYEQGPKTPASTQQLLDANGTLIEQSVAKLKALPQPAGDEAQLAGMYSEVEKLASYSHQMATAAGQGNRQLVNQLQAEGKQQQTAVNASFNAYGLTECGKGS